MHPASRAGTSFATVRNIGMFHGMIAATTPTGSRYTSTAPPNAPRRVSCHGCFAATSARAPIIAPGSRACAEREKVIGAPISVVISCASSS